MSGNIKPGCREITGEKTSTIEDHLTTPHIMLMPTSPPNMTTLVTLALAT
jgi:hypothetical protein